MFLSRELLVYFLILLSSCASNENEGAAVNNLTRNENVENVTQETPSQLNCTNNANLGICNIMCNEKERLPWSSTFCDVNSGSCICDCRDKLPKECKKTPFTPCFQDCVRKNPNPDVYLYEGGNCPVPQKNGTVSYQCVCECSVRDDYDETNDI